MCACNTAPAPRFSPCSRATASPIAAGSTSAITTAAWNHTQSRIKHPWKSRFSGGLTSYEAVCEGLLRQAVADAAGAARDVCQAAAQGAEVRVGVGRRNVRALAVAARSGRDRLTEGGEAVGGQGRRLWLHGSHLRRMTPGPLVTSVVLSSESSCPTGRDIACPSKRQENDRQNGQRTILDQSRTPSLSKGGT